MSARWIRLDTSWSSSEWLAELPPASRLVWIELLCHTKAHGVDGRVRRMAPTVFASRSVTGVTRDDVTVLEEAAIRGQALAIEDGEWVVSHWEKYQGDPGAAARSRAYREGKSALSPSRSAPERNVTSPLVTPTVTETLTVKKKPSVSKKATSLPDDWKPNGAHLTKSEVLDLGIDDEAEAFRDFHLSKANTYADWDRAFHTWLRNAVKFGRNGNGNGSHHERSEHAAMLGPAEIRRLRDERGG